jgi:hypothetical protein
MLTVPQSLSYRVPLIVPSFPTTEHIISASYWQIHTVKLTLDRDHQR